MWKRALMGVLGIGACLPAPSDDPQVETGEPHDEALEPNVGFVLERDWDGHVLSITHLHPHLNAEGAVTTGAQLASTVISERDVLMSLPQPGEADLVEIDPEGAPGMLIAMYTATIHDDVNGDGTHDEGETIVSVGTWLPTWVEGEVPATYQDIGAVPGWNALHISTLLGATEMTPDILSMSMISNMETQDSVTVEGGVVDDPPENGRIALFPDHPDNLLGNDTAGIDAVMDDQTLDRNWQLEAAGSPPDSHLNEDVFWSHGGSIQVPIAYKDTDGSGNFSDGDSLYGAACKDESAGVVVLGWLPQPEGIAQATTLAIHDIAPGWLMATIAESGEWTIQVAEQIEPLVNPACDLPPELE